jgi:hypothetical protein
MDVVPSKINVHVGRFLRALPHLNDGEGLRWWNMELFTVVMKAAMHLTGTLYSCRFSPCWGWKGVWQ